jgi:hypothetical protein
MNTSRFLTRTVPALVTAVKMANAPDIETKAVAVAEEKGIREPEAALTAYIRFYNHHRLHSGIDYHTPEDYERVVT